MTALAERIPVAIRPQLTIYVLVALVFPLGWVTNYMWRAHDTVTVKVHKVEKSWGTPTQSVDGAQVNQAFTGLTCDIYRSRSTVVCHP